MKKFETHTCVKITKQSKLDFTAATLKPLPTQAKQFYFEKILQIHASHTTVSSEAFCSIIRQHNDLVSTMEKSHITDKWRKYDVNKGLRIQGVFSFLPI